MTDANILSARKVYRDMLRGSGMSAADFRAACERHPAFTSCHLDEPAARYTLASMKVYRAAVKVKAAARAADPASCNRCGGAGSISAYQHVDGGVCYDCAGTGKILPA